MLLAVDAGNTNIVFALLDQGGGGAGAIRARWRIATDPRRTADEYAVWLHQLLALEGLARGDVEAVIVCTVVPRALHNLEVLASKYFGVAAIVAGLALHVNLPPVQRAIVARVMDTVGSVANGIAATLLQHPPAPADVIAAVRGAAISQGVQYVQQHHPEDLDVINLAAETLATRLDNTVSGKLLTGSLPLPNAVAAEPSVPRVEVAAAAG